MFQLTHPRGVRLQSSTIKVFCYLFQLTHPRGVRHTTAVRYSPPSTVSTHAPTRGATLAYNILVAVVLFQLTHPRGVRLAGSNQLNNKSLEPTFCEDRKYGSILQWILFNSKRKLFIYNSCEAYYFFCNASCSQWLKL